VCGMIYVAAGFPDLVGLQLGGLPWLTPAFIAFCLTAAFVFGPFVLLKRLPSRFSAAEKPRFHARFRLAAKVLLAISPITYAWTLGVAKEYMPEFVNGELIPPPLSPGMIGFIGCAMFLITFTSAAAAEWLKETIDSLYTLKRESVPQREYAETAAGEAHVALASCRGLIHRAETAIEAVKAAEKKLEVSCQAALQSEQSHLHARKLQAFVLPSRN